MSFPTRAGWSSVSSGTLRPSKGRGGMASPSLSLILLSLSTAGTVNGDPRIRVLPVEFRCACRHTENCRISISSRKTLVRFSGTSCHPHVPAVSAARDPVCYAPPVPTGSSAADPVGHATFYSSTCPWSQCAGCTRPPRSAGGRPPARTPRSN